MNLDARIDVVLGRMVPDNIDLLIAASNGLASSPRNPRFFSK